ncbi:MAG: PaaI family thioesterase [Bacillota bacterium]|nr:PaaI family thioesterase [Bacillota bacterium]
MNLCYNGLHIWEKDVRRAMKPENKGLDETLFAYIVKSVSATPFYDLLGIELREIAPGHVKIAVKAEKKHTNPIGLLHGGLIMSLADAAMGNAIRSLGLKGVTVDCSTSFPGSGKVGSTIIAEGSVLRAGKQMIFAESRVFCDEKLIGHTKATFFNVGAVEL